MLPVGRSQSSCSLLQQKEPLAKGMIFIAIPMIQGSLLVAKMMVK